MPAIFSTIAVVMGPAKMMDHASVILDSSAMTVPVNSLRPFIIGACIYCFALPGVLVLLTKALTIFSKKYTFCINFACTGTPLIGRFLEPRKNCLKRNLSF